MQALELKIPPIAQVIFFAMAMWMITAVAPSAAPLHLPNLWLAAPTTIVGGFISLFGVIEFRRAQTTMDPRVPHETSSLVKSGVYRFSRNPMYLGFLFILTGWAIFLSNWLSFVFLPLFILYINRFQIVPEEWHMLEKFGEEYREYMSKVRRWI
jgi:protein-S-isoprenylcysteine O-methyltransferase Ste14